MKEKDLNRVKELLDSISQDEVTVDSFKIKIRELDDQKRTVENRISNMRIELTKLMNPILSHSDIRDPNPPMRIHTPIDKGQQ